MVANPCDNCKAVCGSDCPYFDEVKELKATGKTYSLRFGRTVNLGNYESAKIELEQEFDECISKDHALEQLARRVEGYAQNRKKNPDLYNPYARPEMEVKMR